MGNNEFNYNRTFLKKTNKQNKKLESRDKPKLANIFESLEPKCCALVCRCVSSD